MNYERAYDFLTKKLKNELNTHITYHDVSHTKKVIASAVIIARAENITGQDLILLKTAALFHDSGFLLSRADHEVHSCRLAKKYLPRYQYNEAEIELICKLIMTTKMPQSPDSQLSRILCDADLYYLGEEGYAHQAENLYQELLSDQQMRSEREWLKMQIDFLGAHSYFTPTANKNCDAGKSINLVALQSIYESSY